MMTNNTPSLRQHVSCVVCARASVANGDDAKNNKKKDKQMGREIPVFRHSIVFV